MRIGVMGAGAWGTALAVHFSKQGHEVWLWTHNAEHAAELAAERCNRRYLADIPFPDSLKIVPELQPASLMIAATPVGGLRSSARLMADCGLETIPVLAACKGFERESGLLPHRVLAEELPDSTGIGVLSGPSFARELALGLPCAVTLASESGRWITQLAAELNCAVLRLYAGEDVTGVAVGGAVKNVMAIAAGISDGLGCGLNARAALMTRGLAEITRLAVALGAQAHTLTGLAGMGDLILTCTGALSRNRQVGLLLAEGLALPDILASLGHVAEGVFTVAETEKLAQYHQVDMPVTHTLYRLLQGEVDAKAAAVLLMERTPGTE